VAAALTAAAGCVQMTIDESGVFVPVAFDAAMAAESGEPIMGGAAFASEAAWKAAWKERTASGRLTGEAPAFVATRQEHGRLKTPEGEIAWTLLSRAGEARPLIVRCGGNASTRQQSGFAYGVTALPHGDVFLFDYPGSGETGGEATPARFAGMGDSLTAFVTEKAAGRKLVLWGHSLGGFVCSDLGRRLPQSDAVILEASARNANEVAKAWTPWFAGPFVKINVAESLAGYDNALALKDFRGPVLVLGAGRDKTLPVRLSRDVADALKAQGANVTYVEFPGGGHSNFGAQPEFAGVIAAFFEKLR